MLILPSIKMFIRAALVAVAVLATSSASAQLPRKVPTIGVLWPNPPATFDYVRDGLRDLGYVEGKNIRFEYRWAQDRIADLPALAADLVREKVDLIVTLAPPATVAAKNSTQTIPIVFVAIGDPVASGLVASVRRPGGNLTGTTRMLSEMTAKHVEFLKQAVPSLSRLGVLWNPANSSHAAALKSANAVAQSLAIHLQAIEVRGRADFDNAFMQMARNHVEGVLFIADPVFFIDLKRLTQLITDARLPSVSNFTEFPKLGGLMGYAPSLSSEFRQAATHIDKILKGAKPSELPIEQPNGFDLVINRSTAQRLGITIPPSLLVRATEVID